VIEQNNSLREPDALEAYTSFDVSSTPLPMTSWGWFREGLMTPILGLKLLFRFKGLFWYFIIPVVIQTVISLVLLSLFYLLGTLLSGWIEWLIEWSTLKISEITNQAESMELSGWADLLIKIAIWIPIVLFFFYVFVIVWRVTGGILTGYFGGRLTDKALQAAGFKFAATQRTTFLGEIFTAWTQAALIAVPTSMVGGLLNLIPFVGTIIAIPVVWGYTIFMTGYDELRDPLQKMGHSRLGTLKICWRHRAATVGLGLAKLVTQPIPLVGGIVQAAESLGRISLAMRILKADGTEISAFSESVIETNTPTTLG